MYFSNYFYKIHTKTPLRNSIRAHPNIPSWGTCNNSSVIPSKILLLGSRNVWLEIFQRFYHNYFSLQEITLVILPSISWIYLLGVPTTTPGISLMIHLEDSFKHFFKTCSKNSIKKSWKESFSIFLRFLKEFLQ